MRNQYISFVVDAEGVADSGIVARQEPSRGFPRKPRTPDYPAEGSPARLVGPREPRRWRMGRLRESRGGRKMRTPKECRPVRTSTRGVGSSCHRAPTSATWARLLSRRMDSPVRLTTMAPAVMRSQIASAAVESSIRRGKLSGENWEPTPSLTGRGNAQAGFCQGLPDDHGSAARTRTPVEGSANTCPKLPTCPNPSQWTPLPIPSRFNGRPRETPGYMTPTEKLAELVVPTG